MADSPFIASLLAAQADLSAVERFAQRHARATEPVLARHYRDLLPLSAPRPGEQYAFAVDLDACTGCKACVAACHSLNGLDPDESWRRVGTLVGDDAEGGAVLQNVTMACHHCADPACLQGCPVGAYDKDATTGIVRHLDDQCIGCRYCVMMCPYEVPQYSASRGIVRKCDMCHGRLAAGEAPACVQACPTEAIRIRVVPTDAPPTMRLADAPPPELTRPTTRYRSRRTTAVRWRAIDAERTAPADPHDPLVVMLTASQLAVGCLIAALAASTWSSANGARTLATAGALTLLFGLAASVRHLGRPRKAWRVFLGLATSWLSREIVAFGAAAALAGAYLAGAWTSGPGSPASLALGAAAAVVGLAAIACSAMVYHATGRGLWCFVSSGGQFFGTTLSLGAAALALTAWSTPGIAQACAALVGCVTASKLVGLAVLMCGRADRLSPPVARTVALLRGRLRPLTVLRTAMGALALSFAVAVAMGHPAAAVLVLACSVAGEGAERALFFRAISPARMPGSL